MAAYSMSMQQPGMTSLCGCRFEVETDGESMDVLDVSLDKMKDESADEQDEPGDDQDSAYGGPVRPHTLVCQCYCKTCVGDALQLSSHHLIAICCASRQWWCELHACIPSDLLMRVKQFRQERCLRPILLHQVPMYTVHENNDNILLCRYSLSLIPSCRKLSQATWKSGE